MPTIEEKPVAFQTDETKLLNKVKSLKEERDNLFSLERGSMD